MGMRTLQEIYSAPAPVLSVEFWPPKTEAGEAALRREAKSIVGDLNPAFCSMTYGAGGSTRERTVDLVSALHREFGVDVMCHLTVVDQSRAQVRSVLDRLRESQVRNIIALGGDPAPGVEWAPHPEGFAHADELVADAHPEFSVAVAGFPEVHPRAESRESDLRHLKRKVDLGARVVITQLFFDNDDYFRFVDDARRIGIEAPIVPGVMPIVSVSGIRRFTALCQARIPDRLAGRLDQVGDDAEAAVRMGIEYATEQCDELLRGGAPGLHFYALNKARSVLEINERLGLST
ncbi:methylenetetrahydrofolate reductase [NAD(P)H] [Pseudonocardia eucalypti]|uniref:Methylenetetrahydrofolate reductase n=2 Tax=Pseudonocardia eucalypti TaxID=648755 RepID=A0ABP9PTM2_9PSEU